MMRSWIRLLLVVALTASMVGCGSSTRTPAGEATKTPTTGSASPTPVALPDFIARMQAGSQLAFTATYVIAGVSVGNQVTVQQQLPKYYSASTDGTTTETRVTDGTDQYLCQSETKTCTRSSWIQPIRDFAGYYVAEYWIAKMQQWPTSIAGQYNAVTITPSTLSLADQRVDCITYQNPSETAKVCLFDSGVVASVRSGSADFFATQYAPTVSPGIFAVPAGYAVAAE